MTGWSSAFLLLAFAAAVFGFTGMPNGATGAIQVLFCVFLVLSIAASAAGSLAKRKPGQDS